MKVLALLSPRAGATLDDFGPLRVAEERQVWALYRDGVVRELYWQLDGSRVDTLRAVFVLEAEDVRGAGAAVGTLPMVRAGLLGVELITLGPWLPLEALFDRAPDGAHPAGTAAAAR